ncbi:MAG: hypothetical protein NVSMB5_11410 [Candidatus Velthaea sp.]
MRNDSEFEPAPSKLRVRLDRTLIDELKAVAGEGADISALIEDEIRALVERLRSQPPAV